MLDRIKGVLKLNPDTFEEIEKDESATGQAAIVVLIVAVIASIGSGIGASYMDGNVGGGMLSTIISTFAGWLMWSAVTFFIGTRLFGGTSNLGEMLRVIGFAYAPQMLGIIPCLGGIIGSLWSLAAGFVAVRQGLDLDNTKAFLTILVGFLAYIAVAIVVGMIFGVGSGGWESLQTAF